MARYVLDCIMVNGVVVIDCHKFTLTMDADKTVKAIYVEAQPLSIVVKNMKAEDVTLVKLSSEIFTVPAGGEVSIPWDPAKDKLVIK